MPDTPVPPPMFKHGDAAHRHRVAQRLQEIEGNPFDAEDLAMFEMFDREGWSPERCREYILANIGLRGAG